MSTSIVEKFTQEAPIKIRYYQLYNNGVGIVIWPQLRASSDPDGTIVWDGKNHDNLWVGVGRNITIDLEKYMTDTNTPFYLSENTMWGVDFYDKSQKFLYDPNSTTMAIATRNGAVDTGELVWQGTKPGPSSLTDSKGSTELATLDLAAAIISHALTPSSSNVGIWKWLGKIRFNTPNPNLLVIVGGLIARDLIANHYNAEFHVDGNDTVSVKIKRPDSLNGPVPPDVKAAWAKAVKLAQKQYPKVEDLGVKDI